MINDNKPTKNLKDISEKEFNEKLKEYSKKIKNNKKAVIPNEPVGSINHPKTTNEL